MPTENARLPFEIDDTIDPPLVTGRAGVPLVIELFRQLGVAQMIDAEVAVKQRQRGLPPAHLVESLIALWTSGGDRCQDLTTLRADHALATLLGYPLPAATTVRDFLEAFHVEGGPLWAAGPQTAIPLESAPLAGLDTANRTLVAGLQRGARVRTATLDVDATLVKRHKDAATIAYDGTRGSQPVLVLWAEQDLILHDQFRDGQVPAGCGNVRVLEQAVGNLPQGITQLALRADSALYETAVLQWCEARKIAYAISADMSKCLSVNRYCTDSALMIVCLHERIPILDCLRRTVGQGRAVDPAPKTPEGATVPAEARGRAETPGPPARLRGHCVCAAHGLPVEGAAPGAIREPQFAPQILPRLEARRGLRPALAARPRRL
jgi:hypothetical protein